MTDLHWLSADEAVLSYGAGTLRPSELTEALLRRIGKLNEHGPDLRAVITVADDAVELARASDGRWAHGRPAGPLDGVPVLVKDNIDTADLPTTAGSIALLDDLPSTDASLVTRLRSAGAIVIGKANLSEWANFRGHNSISGWSAVGGLCRNPHALERSAGGSSAGSGSGVAAGFAPLAVGTETDGSIMCPAANCGVVGIKPTVGLISGQGIVPISHTQDTAGPMARSVADAALLLAVLTDPSAPVQADEFVAATRAASLAGIRVAHAERDWGAALNGLLATALAAIDGAGASMGPPSPIGTVEELATFATELPVLLYEFHAGLDAYLATRPDAPIRTVDELIAFNLELAEVELRYFGQELLELSASTGGLDDPTYLTALARNRELAGPQGIDAALDAAGADVLVMPTAGPAWMIDLEHGDKSGLSTWQPAAAAGYPTITVPMGMVDGLPVGCSFVGRPWSEATLLRVAAAVEAALALDARPLAAGHV